MTPVLSYSERPDLAGEVASAAAEVAKALGAESAAVELDEVSPGLRTRGKVFLVKGQRQLESDPDLAAAALVAVAKAKGFRALLVGETRFGNTVAAKVAARLRVPSLGKGKAFKVDGGRLVSQRDVYAGKFVARVAAKLPCVALVQAGAYKQQPAPGAPAETISFTGPEPRVAMIEAGADAREPAGIKSASIVVAAGRGFERREDLALAQGLAGALGAALGCSRPLSSDLGWFGEDAAIGLSGAYVHPKLYIAVGISGQLQHLAGIKDSKVIVAINKDPQAPIFQVADYGIVGDLYQILPALTKLLTRS